MNDQIVWNREVARSTEPLGAGGSRAEVRARAHQSPSDRQRRHAQARVSKDQSDGHIPVLDDNGFIVWEAMAINLYLAEKYGHHPFWPSAVEGHAGAYQWSLWGETELERHVLTIQVNKMVFSAEQQSDHAVKNAIDRMKASLKVLNHHLQTREYLLGKDFTIGDLNVASIWMVGSFTMNLLGVRFDLSDTPTAEQWFKKCTGREAAEKLLGMK